MIRKQRKDEKKDISRDILAYLTDNPDADDTVSGIVEWWLLEQHIRDKTAAVQKALDEMVRKGLILERKAKDSQVRYCINPNRIRDVERRKKNR